MTSPNEERLSGLVDGELSPQENQQAINYLLKDPAACACWERYHLISDALKRNLPPALKPDFSASVMAALQQEPTILAPMRRAPGALTKRLAGLAVAASVAAIGVLGVQYLYQQDGLVTPPAQVAQTPQPQGQTAVIAQSPAGALNGRPVASGIQLVQQGGVVQESSEPRTQSLPSNLNRYLVDHSQQTARGVQGVIPYARIVTYPAVGPDISKPQK